MFQIQGQSFYKDKISRLYPAAIIKTGYGDEVTQISLEWIDEQIANDQKIDIVHYAIFVHLKDHSVSSFTYADRPSLEKALDELSTYF